MTKNWEEIREEACRLYIAGSSLTYIKTRLEGEQNFKASERSFREKFKDWGITRRIQLQKWKDRNELMAQTASPRPTKAQLTTTKQDMITRGRAQSEPVRSVSLEQYTSQPSTLQNERASRSPDIDSLSHLNAIVESVDELADTYLALQAAGNGPQVRQVLDGASITASTDTILHYAASQSEFRILEYIVEYRVSNNLGIDLPDPSGSTALCIAIRANQKANVDILLQGGIAVNERQQGGQALHLAITTEASRDICCMLLDHCADVNGRQHSNTDCRHTPLTIAWDAFWTTPHAITKEYHCSILELLLEKGATTETVSTHHLTALLQFLLRWSRWDQLHRSNASKKLFRLWHFLGTGCSPTCWFPRQYCPSKECSSFASYVFAHTPNSGLSIMLVESVDLKQYGENVMNALVSPCASRSQGIADTSISLLVGHVLKMLDQLGVSIKDGNSFALKVSTNFEGREKIDLLDVLSQHKKLDLREPGATSG